VFSAFQGAIIASRIFSRELHDGL
jgi:hypothetical protein